MRFRLTPRETSFYDMFAASADNIVTGSKLLMELLGADSATRTEIAERMRAAEHAGDDATHAIFHQLNSSFITPFDREDIYSLASQLDDIMDFMEEAVDLVVLYQVDELPKGVEQQIEVLARAAELTAEAMPNLRTMTDLTEYWIEVNRLENQADQIHRKLLAQLFNGKYDAMDVLKLKQIVDVLEEAADAFEHVANTVETIAVKESLTPVDTLALVVVIGVALFFTYTNGFHDSANAIATSVSTRALTPRAALLMAAVMNLAGAFLGGGVAKTVSKGIIDTPTGKQGMIILFSALIGAIVWNLATWYFGLPSSSSHALFGGMVGAALAGSSTVYWHGVLDKIVIPMIVSPVVGLCVGYLVMVAVLWIFRRANPHKAKRGFRIAQTVSAAAMALGHGLQDAQKTMGVVVMALTIAGVQDGSGIPIWVKFACASMLSLGTYAGGWRIMRTLGRKIIELDPPQGFAAETTASSILYTTSYVFQAPISTTHVITSAIMGVGATKRVKAVRWGVAKNIVMGWFITMPAAGCAAALVYGVTHLVFG